MPNRLLTVHLPQDAALVADLLRQVESLCCDHELVARGDVAGDGLVITIESQAERPPHGYLSTACLHEAMGDLTGRSADDLHAYCESMTGVTGAKRGSTCKFCGAPCTCPRHTKEPTDG